MLLFPHTSHALQRRSHRPKFYTLKNAPQQRWRADHGRARVGGRAAADPSAAPGSLGEIGLESSVFLPEFLLQEKWRKEGGGDVGSVIVARIKGFARVPPKSRGGAAGEINSHGAGPSPVSHC